MSTADQMGLFGEIKPAKPKIRPWRRTKLEVREPDQPFDPADLDAVAHAADLLCDVLVRTRELSRACELRDLRPDSDWLERFSEADADVVGLYVQVRLGSDQVEDFEKEIFVPARERAERLAALRNELLGTLDAEALDRFLKTESRVKVKEYEVWQELAGIEFAVGEELGLVQEVELPISALSGQGSGDHGLILPGDVDDMTDAYLREMKEEQDSRPLPKQGKLATLLKGIPVVWLDAVARCLDVEIEGSRKDREMKIAETLCDADRLRAVVESNLDEEERELLARLVMKEGGQMPAKTIYKKYGKDENDGWFWNEVEPYSVLGGLRVNGLVFVGETEDHGRTAMIPKELRASLGEILAASTSRSAWMTNATTANSPG